AVRATKTGDQERAVAGGPISWTLTVTNAGPSTAHGVVLTDPVPAGVLGVSATPTVGTCDTTIACRLGDVPVGAVVTVVLRGTVDPAWTGGDIENRAAVTTVDPAPDPGAPEPPPPVVTPVD